MPQLDKYIFFNHIIYLTIFFSLIYIYVRGTIIPTISTILKYRKKKANSLAAEINNYSILLATSKTYINQKGKVFIAFLVEKIDILNAYYQKESTRQSLAINNRLFSQLKKITLISNSILKSRIELRRLKFVTK